VPVDSRDLANKHFDIVDDEIRDLRRVEVIILPMFSSSLIVAIQAIRLERRAAAKSRLIPDRNRRKGLAPVGKHPLSRARIWSVAAT